MTTVPTNPMDSSPAETFAASRWTQGNFLFPTKLVISPQRVSRVKSRLFGSNEESIAMSKIASVHIFDRGLLVRDRDRVPGGLTPLPATATPRPMPSASAI